MSHDDHSIEVASIREALNLARWFALHSRHESAGQLLAAVERAIDALYRLTAPLNDRGSIAAPDRGVASFEL